mmetsp:Transcript_15174/g.27651  ORF Transcript_15174/g.27651 Transcript_15174/m.27651 type:complete len:242 (-) Transcript_15174:182-907(-)
MDSWVHTTRWLLQCNLQQLLHWFLGLWRHSNRSGFAGYGVRLLVEEFTSRVKVFPGVLPISKQASVHRPAHINHLLHHLVVGLAREQYSASGKLKCSRTCAPDVDLRVVIHTQDDLRSPVITRLHIRRFHGLRDIHGTAKVTNFDLGLVHGHEHIIRLQVAVDDLQPSESPQALEKLTKIHLHRCKGQPRSLTVLLQCEAHVTHQQLKDKAEVSLMLKGSYSPQVDQVLSALRVLLWPLLC